MSNSFVHVVLLFLLCGLALLLGECAASLTLPFPLSMLNLG